MKRIVVKIGDINRDYAVTGKPNLRIIEKYVRVMADLHNRGYEIVFVSSGAIAVGVAKLKIERPENIPEKQAVAAVRSKRANKYLRQSFQRLRFSNRTNSFDKRRNNGRRKNKKCHKYF